METKSRFTKAFIVTVTAIALSTSAMAQVEELSTEQQLAQLQEQLTTLQEQVESLKSESEVASKASETKKESGFYTPQIFGAIMATLNVGTYDGLTRFNVRNSRIGFKGNAARDLSYQVQIDFHNQGSVSILDAYIAYKHKNFGFKLGQQHINLSEDLKRGPADALFTTRSLTAISSTAYVSGSDGDYSLKSLGSRDIGAYLDYTLRSSNGMPINFGFGVFNGGGSNNPIWTHELNYSARIILGDVKSGFSGGASLYAGKNSLDQDMRIWTAEARYVSSDLFVETTVQQRRLNDDGLELLHAANIQGYYNFKLSNCNFFDVIAPTLRWDMGHNMSYIVEDSEGVIFDAEHINANRLTAAVNMRFPGNKLRSRMMIGYEFIFTDQSLTDIAYNELMQDKFTFALICAF